MLDHDEERRLAEIEERLRLEAPDLEALFERSDPGSDEAAAAPARPRRESHRRPRRARSDRPLTAIVRSFAAIVAAIAITTVATLLVGPDVGGFVAVVVFCIAGMYAYQTLRGCPGLRRARGDG